MSRSLSKKKEEESIRKNIERRKKNEERSNMARGLLHQLIEQEGYSPYELAELLDSTPYLVYVCSRKEHWRGVPWSLSDELFKLDLATLPPPRGDEAFTPPANL